MSPQKPVKTHDRPQNAGEDRLAAAAAARILILDGAMGTMIQRHRLTEGDYRGERFKDWPRDLRGNNELLSLTRPDIVRDIHAAYFAAGADIVETNTFNANVVSQADYGMEALAPELNLASAKLAREAAEAAATPERPRFVAGAIGPTNRSASISPDVNRPQFRNITFDELVAAYRQQAEALLEGGVDIFLVETIFDTLNAKAALFALDALFEERGVRLPVMVSGTVTDMSGRNLSGQTVEAFWNSVRHARPFSIGLNCAFGAKELRPYIGELARKADTRICAYPNAGLPNEMGAYDEAPADTAGHLKEWARAGFLNIVGGCCGTTPEHIAAIAAAVEGIAPRKVPAIEPRLRLSGLEAFTAAS